MLGKGPNAALAQDYVVVALGHDVFRCEQPFFECCGHSSFKEYRPPRPASPPEKRKVLHVTGADLNDVAILSIRST